jgi:uncharacterized membrane protein
LVRGWLLMVGLFAGIIFGIWTVFFAIRLVTLGMNTGLWYDPEEIFAYTLFGALSLLAVPGLLIMRRVRRTEQTKAQPRV